MQRHGLSRAAVVCEVVEAGIEGLRRYGAGTGSVRFICGTFAAHLELERELADFSGTEAALTYVSCWNANEAVIVADLDLTKATRKYALVALEAPRFLAPFWRQMVSAVRRT